MKRRSSISLLISLLILMSGIAKVSQSLFFPVPDVSTSVSSVQINVNSRFSIEFEVADIGGPSSTDSYLSISISHGLDVVSWSSTPSLPDLAFNVYEIGDLVWNNQYEQIPAEYVLLDIHGHPFESDESITVTVVFEGRLSQSSDEWIKYRAAMLPEGVNYPTDVSTARAPASSAEIDQQGYAVYMVDVHVSAEPPPEPSVEVKVTNRYETNKLVTFLDYLLLGVRYPIDCILETTISDQSNIERVYLKVTGLSVEKIDMLKISEGHYKVEIKAVEQFSAGDLRDVAYFFLKLWFAHNGKSLAPSPWAYSEPPDYVVDIEELVIVYEDGSDFRVYYPIKPLPRLPTYKDVIESMFPIWGSDDVPVVTTIVALSPIDILVTDSSRKRVGSVYEDGKFVSEVNEIPDSFYTGKDFSPEFIYIPSHPGQHNVQVVGIETGQYVLDILFQDENQPILKEFSGSVIEATVHKYKIEVKERIPNLLSNLSIHVRDSDGNPITGATVTSISQPTGQSAFSSPTDVNGYVIFCNIKAGSYAIRVSKSGYASASKTETVEANQTTTDTIALNKESPIFPTIDGGIELWWVLIVAVVLIVIIGASWLGLKRTRKEHGEDKVF